MYYYYFYPLPSPPGPVNAVLSWPGWVALSRLTYAVYLTHPLVIFVIYYSRYTPIYMDDFTVVSDDSMIVSYLS